MTIKSDWNYIDDFVEEFTDRIKIMTLHEIDKICNEYRWDFGIVAQSLVEDSCVLTGQVFWYLDRNQSRDEIYTSYTGIDDEDKIIERVKSRLSYIAQVVLEENGMSSPIEILEFCYYQKVNFDDAEKYLRTLGLRIIGKNLLPSSPIGDLLEAVFLCEGMPISLDRAIRKYELEIEKKSLQTICSTDERFIRVNKNEYFLTGNGFDEYLGIAREMEKELTQTGKIKLSRLEKKLAATKGIKSTSIKLFSSAPIFLLENDYISLRHSSNQLTVVPSEVEGESRLMRDGNVEMTFQCNSNLLRGSGIQISSGSSALLGVQPSTVKRFKNGKIEIQVTWDKYSMNPRISSLRNIANSLDARIGNTLVLTFNLVTGFVMATISI